MPWHNVAARSACGWPWGHSRGKSAASFFLSPYAFSLEERCWVCWEPCWQAEPCRRCSSTSQHYTWQSSPALRAARGSCASPLACCLLNVPRGYPRWRLSQRNRESVRNDQSRSFLSRGAFGTNPHDGSGAPRLLIPHNSPLSFWDHSPRLIRPQAKLFGLNYLESSCGARLPPPHSWRASSSWFSVPL